MRLTEFVTVTLVDPNGPSDVVHLVRLPAIVQAINEDGTADLTVFSNGALAKSQGPCFFLEKVEADAKGLKVPSFMREEVASTEPVAQGAQQNGIAASHNDFGVGGAPQGAVGGLPSHGNVQGHGLKVFGKGTLRQSVSHGRTVFRSAGEAIARGDISPETVARLGPPKAAIPGQKKPRVFVKGKGEITKAAPEKSEEDVLTDILGAPPPLAETLGDAGGAEIVFTGEVLNGNGTVVPQQRAANGGRPL